MDYPTVSDRLRAELRGINKKMDHQLSVRERRRLYRRKCKIEAILLGRDPGGFSMGIKWKGGGIPQEKQKQHKEKKVVVDILKTIEEDWR